MHLECEVLVELMRRDGEGEGGREGGREGEREGVGEGGEGKKRGVGCCPREVLKYKVPPDKTQTSSTCSNSRTLHSFKRTFLTTSTSHGSLMPSCSLLSAGHVIKFSATFSPTSSNTPEDTSSSPTRFMLPLCSDLSQSWSGLFLGWRNRWESTAGEWDQHGHSPPRRMPRIGKHKRRWTCLSFSFVVTCTTGDENCLTSSPPVLYNTRGNKEWKENRTERCGETCSALLWCP
jgi:hypothetical protein